MAKSSNRESESVASVQLGPTKAPSPIQPSIRFVFSGFSIHPHPDLPPRLCREMLIQWSDFYNRISAFVYLKSHDGRKFTEAI